MSTNADWANAFARQAIADFATWQQLQITPSAPECHKLLFLQMTCEKLTKAHLCSAGAGPPSLQSSHAYISKNLPIVIGLQAARSHLTGRNRGALMRFAKQLAGEIELLAPAVKRGGKRMDNCEYPWEDDQGKLHVPLDWTFLPSRLLLTPIGRTFVKLLGRSLGR